MSNTPTTPSGIAAWLDDHLYGITVEYGNTGGNVMCITTRPTGTYIGEPHRQLAFGLGSGNLGWSDEHGDNFEEWDDILNTVDAFHAWQTDRDLPEAEKILDLIESAIRSMYPSPQWDTWIYSCTYCGYRTATIDTAAVINDLTGVCPTCGADAAPGTFGVWTETLAEDGSDWYSHS